MSLPVKPYTFANGTTADALQVNANFDQLYAALAAGGLDPSVFAASALGSREVGLDLHGVQVGPTGQVLTNTWTDLTAAAWTVTPETASTLLVVFRAGLKCEVLSGQQTSASVALLIDGVTIFTGSSVIAGGSNGVVVGGVSVGFGSQPISAGAHSVKLQGQMATGSAGAAIVSGYAQAVGLLVAA